MVPVVVSDSERNSDGSGGRDRHGLLTKEACQMTIGN
jgi:hypothetical protein